MKPEKLLLAVIVSLALSPFHCLADDQEPLHWYSVSFSTGSTQASAHGSSPLDEAAFAKALEGSTYIELSNLVYFDQWQNPKEWSDWTKYDEACIYINPKDISSFQPMKDDPRKVAATAAAAAAKK